MSDLRGRGAWPANGKGGTVKFKDSSKPGSYYGLGSGVRVDTSDINSIAVRRAVRAYQRQLNIEIKSDLKLDGKFGSSTFNAVREWQSVIKDYVQVSGFIGPATSKLLFQGALGRVVERHDGTHRVTPAVVSGLIEHESQWDVGAVGYADPRDRGLAQINSAAHPTYDNVKAFTANRSFEFIIDYLTGALKRLDNDMELAIASYNLGVGGWSSNYQTYVGAIGWDKSGRPDFWQPPGNATVRNVRGYIDKVLKG